MMMKSENRKIGFTTRKTILWIVLIITPFIALFILCLSTNTGLLHLDAYNTTWNDETGYLRAVRIIRTQGLPTGVVGYNEVASEIPAYGAYTILTYLPYAAVSFLTGISSHNFVYFSNVILIVIANFIFVMLVKPDEKKTIWLILFSGLSLVYERYVWSGMSEASHCAFVIILLACFLWLFTDQNKTVAKERVVLWIAIGLTLYFGMIRPFQFVWLLVPIVYIAWKNKKKVRWVEILCVIAAFVLCYLFYRFLSLNWSAQYFSDSSTSAELSSYLQMLRNGQIGGATREILLTNKDALKTVLAKLQELKWVGLVTTIFFVNELILLIQAIRAGISKKKNQAVLNWLCFAIGILIYEANILLYTINQCHRMLLSFVVLSAYLICMSEGGAVLKGIRQGAETVMIIASLCVNTSSFGLPQVNEDIDVAKLEQRLTEVLNFDEDNPWGNTIADNVETSNLYVNFCTPIYMNFNTCTDAYLKESILNDKIKSKYIMLADGHELNSICQNKYDVVWQEYGYTIYLNER